MIFNRHINEKSRWCAAFDKEDLQVMEYGEDLIEYYESGYGIAEYNIQLGCPMVKDLYRKMEEAVNGTYNEYNLKNACMETDFLN